MISLDLSALNLPFPLSRLRLVFPFPMKRLMRAIVTVGILALLAVCSVALPAPVEFLDNDLASPSKMTYMDQNALEQLILDRATQKLREEYEQRNKKAVVEIEEEIPQFPFPKDALTNPESNDLYCSACTWLIDKLTGKACAWACKAIPNPIAAAICSFVVSKANLCSRIADWVAKGDSKEVVCKKLGFCNNACQCGLCTPAIAGPDGRCLGLISSCGHPYPQLTASDMFALSPGPSRDFSSLAGANSGNCSKSNEADKLDAGFCLHGRCDGKAHYGCCLTCF